MRPQRIYFSDNIPIKADIQRIINYPLHWHPSLELIFVLQGSIDVKLGSSQYHLKKQQIAVVNADEIHSISSKDDGNRVLLLHINQENEHLWNYTKDLFFFNCCSPENEHFLIENYRRLRKRINDFMYDLKKTKNPHKDSFLAHSLILMEELTKHFDYYKIGEKENEFTVEQAAKIKAFLKKNDPLTSSCSLEVLARNLELSYYHLSNKITKIFGYTFQELLHYYRLEYAVKLLLTTKLRIIDIAYDCGFSDPKYLIKYFKYYFQCTPSEFKKQHKATEESLNNQLQYTSYPISNFFLSE